MPPTGGDPKKPCGYCKHPKTAHKENCPYRDGGKPRPRAGHRKRKSVKKLKRGARRAAGGDTVAAAIRARIQELELQKEKLEDVLAVIEG